MLPNDFDMEKDCGTDKITSLSNNLGYSLFYQNTPKGRKGAASQGLGQVGQGEGEEFEGDQISVIESILHHSKDDPTPEYLSSWNNL